LNNGFGVPVYSRHAEGFSMCCEWTTNASGWGSAPVKRVILTAFSDWLKSGEKVFGNIGQLANSSNEYIYLRGGSKYVVDVFGRANTDINYHTSNFTAKNQTLSSPIDFVTVPVTDMSTKIGKDFIQTTNIYAENLRIKSANIQGKLSANQIDVATLKAELVTAKNINALYCDFKKGKVGGFKMTDTTLENLDNFGNGARISSASGKIYLSNEIGAQSSIGFHVNGSFCGGISGDMDGNYKTLKIQSHGIMNLSTRKYDDTIFNFQLEAKDILLGNSGLGTKSEIRLFGALRLENIYRDTQSSGSGSSPKSIDTSYHSTYILGSGNGNSDEYIQFVNPREGRLIYVVNVNDSKDIYIKNILDDPNGYFELRGGTAMTLIYVKAPFYGHYVDNAKWVIFGIHDHTW